MSVHIYFSLIPEALIASMLSPEKFGHYYVVDTKKKTNNRAIFFEVDPEFRHDYFRIDEGILRCVPHVDGQPKASIYISVYRVLEHMPISALGKLYLVTQHGNTLELVSSTQIPSSEAENLHLYKEIAPISPLVASRLSALDFFDLIVKNPLSLVTLPAIAFAELDLGQLAQDPEMGEVGNLPYENLDNLREVLKDLKTKTVATKMVNRTSRTNFPYRTIKDGFYIGNSSELAFYPMPSSREIREKNYAWWRSANM